MGKTSKIFLSVLLLLGFGCTFSLAVTWETQPIARLMESSATNSSLAPNETLTNSHFACTAFCLDNGDHCVFGANQDNTVEIGLVLINPRHVMKTAWEPGVTGEYARWVSKYGSVTINFVGYQMAWAGMNEAGLMISTMYLAETRGPSPDGRPPLEGPFWMQYQLDTHSTIEQVIASDAQIRLVESAVDHYLVCDRTGACAVIELLEGKMVYRTGEDLPVKVLTNNLYSESSKTWEESLSNGNLPEDNSLWRFCMAANRLKAFIPSNPEQAVAYAFDTLAAVSRQDTVWSFVFDPVGLRVHFRTNHNPRIRYLDLSNLDFSCRNPVRMLNVHADVAGDVRDEFVDYTHARGYAHSIRFFKEYTDAGLSPFLVDALLWGLESFPCQESSAAAYTDLERYDPLLPPTVIWAGLTVLHRGWPLWIVLVASSLVYLIWRLAKSRTRSEPNERRI